MLPGPMDSIPYSQQSDKRPPGSNIRYRGLNPSPLGTRLGAKIIIFTLRLGLGLGFRAYFKIYNPEMDIGKRTVHREHTHCLRRGAALPREVLGEG